MRFIHVTGPFCRTCGTSIVRDMTTATLWQGWWSPLSLALFNFLAIVVNLIARLKLNKLPPPAPGQPGRQLDPGKPIFRRPAAFVMLLPLLWFIAVIVQIIRHS